MGQSSSRTHFKGVPNEKRVDYSQSGGIARESARNRALAAVAGAFVADAASAPLNLVYDRSQLDAISESSEDGELEFSGKMKNKTDIIGNFSPLGTAAMQLMKTIASRGFFDTQSVVTEFNELKNVHNLPLVAVPILVARYAGSPALLQFLDELCFLSGADEDLRTASALMAKLLEQVVLGRSISSCLSWAKSPQSSLVASEKYLLRDVDTTESTEICISPQKPVNVEKIDQSRAERGSSKIVNQLPITSASNVEPRINRLPFVLACEMIGQSARMREVVRGAVYAMECFKSYPVAIRANIRVGGHSVLRAWIIGSFLSAEGATHDSCEAIPELWKRRTILYQDVFWLANQIAGSNSTVNQRNEKSFCSVPRVLA